MICCAACRFVFVDGLVMCSCLLLLWFVLLVLLVGLVLELAVWCFA